MKYNKEGNFKASHFKKLNEDLAKQAKWQKLDADKN